MFGNKDGEKSIEEIWIGEKEERGLGVGDFERFASLCRRLMMPKFLKPPCPNEFTINKAKAKNFWCLRSRLFNLIEDLRNIFE